MPIFHSGASMAGGDGIRKPGANIFAPNIGGLPHGAGSFLGGVRRTPLQTMVSSLKAAGIWNLLDVIYVLAGPDRATSVVNIKNPGTFDAIEVNGPITFSAYRGFTGNGTNQRLRTQYTPSTNGVNYTLNDASMWLWCNTDAAITVADIGNVTAPRVRITTRNASNLYEFGVNDATNSTAANALDSIGFYGVQRVAASGAGAKVVWKNGAQVGTATTASTAIASQEQWMLGANSTVFSAKQQAFAAWGGSLTGKEATFYSIVRAYMVAVGNITNALPAMGDSFTFNAAYPDLPSAASFYPAYMASLLASTYSKTLLSQNYGVAGNTTTQMLARQTTSGSLNAVPGAFTYIIYGGINDPANGINSATTQSNIVTMATNAINAGYKYVLIVGQHYANYTGGDTTTVQSSAYLDIRNRQQGAVATLQATYGSRVAYVNSYSYMAALITNGTYVQNDWASWHEADGDIHLNANGEQVILPGAILATMQANGMTAGLY